MDNEILATKNARKIIQDAIFKDLQYKTTSDASFVTNQLIKGSDERDKQKAEEEEIRKKAEEKIVDQESSLLKANSSAKNMQPDDN